MPGDGGGGPEGRLTVWYGRVIRLTSAVTVALGLGILVVTAIHGGGVTGFLIGALFVAAGAGRLTMLRRSGR